MRLNLISLAVTTVLILGVAGWFWHVSGQYEIEPVYGLRAPTTWIQVSQAKPWVVPFTYADVPIAGIVLYSDDPSTTASALDVAIEDKEGRVMARARRQATYYPQSGEPAMYVFLSSASYEVGQSLRLVVGPRGDEPVRFLANEAIEGEDSHQLVFSLLYQRSVSSGAKQGILIGVAVGLSMALLYSIRFIKVSWQWIVAAVMVVMTAGLVCLPYIYRLDAWGINDWDYRHSLSHIYQTTLREYHQIPLWNPFICGGAAALGDPEFALFTPSFVLQFLFGVESGTGLALLFGLMVTGLGMLWLSRLLGQEPVAAVLAATIVMCSSALLLKMTEGHVTIAWAYMWVPWMMGAWLKAYLEWGKETEKKYEWAFVAGVFLTLMLLQGGIYILSYTMLLFVGLIVLSRRHRHALLVSLLAGVWMLGLSSFQLLPTVFWMQEFPDKVFVGSTYTWDKLPDIFLGRYMHGTFILHDQLSNWHEYGAYVGWGVVILLVSSLFAWRSSRVVRALCIGLLVTILFSSLGPLLAPMLSHLPFLPRSNISRLTLFSVLSAALLAGFGVSYGLRRWPRYAFLFLTVAGTILALPASPLAALVPLTVEHRT